MKSFKQYYSEAMEIPEAPKGIIRSMLNKLPHHSVARLAYDVAKDVFKFNSETSKPIAKNCLEVLERWIKEPSGTNADRAYMHARTALQHERIYGANPYDYQRALMSAAWAAYTTLTHSYIDAASDCILEACQAAAHATGEYNTDVYDEHMARYKQMANNYQAKATQSLHKLQGYIYQEPEVGVTAIILDMLEELGLAPEVLKNFGVDEHKSNTDNAKAIHDKGFADNFYGVLRKLMH